MVNEGFKYSTGEKNPLDIDAMDNEIESFISSLNNYSKHKRLNYLTAEFIESQLGRFFDRIKNNYTFNQTQNEKLINRLADAIAQAVVYSFEFYARRLAGKIRERHHEPLEREEYQDLIPILQTELTQIRQTILSRQVVDDCRNFIDLCEGKEKRTPGAPAGYPKTSLPKASTKRRKR
jgi:flagellar motor switch protein FliG